MVVEKIRTNGLKVPVVEGLIVTRGHCVARVAYSNSSFETLSRNLSSDGSGSGILMRGREEYHHIAQGGGGGGGGIPWGGGGWGETLMLHIQVPLLSHVSLAYIYACCSRF